MSKAQHTRICHISTVHHCRDVRIFYRQCCSLAEAGYDVHLIIPADVETVERGVHIHPLPAVKSRLLRMLIMPWVAMIKALRTRAAIYHYHDPELLFMGFVLRWILCKKVVFDVHESVARQVMSKDWLPRWSRRAAAVLYKLIEKIFIRGQELILASEHSVPDYPARAYLVRNYPVLCNGLPVRVEHRSKKAEKPLLLYVGGISEIRGAKVYIELAGELTRRGHDFQMQLVGPCEERLRGQLKSRIEQLNLQTSIQLIDRMDWPQAMQLVSRATIGMCLLLAVPNYTASLATKILEYMMLGTPVLASNFDCWRDIVEGEKVGRMANVTNISEAADVCEQMLNNPEELAEMGKRGAKAVRSRYNWSSELRQLIKCYQKLGSV